MENNQEEWLKIYWELSKTEKELIISYDVWHEILLAIKVFFLFGLPFIIFFLIFGYLSSGIAMFFELSYLLLIFPFFSLITFVPLGLFIYGYKRKREILFDNQSKKVMFNNKSRRFKTTEIIEFHEIKEVSSSYDGGGGYALAFIFQNSRKRNFFFGSMATCKKLGQIVTEFLDKPFIEKPDTKRRFRHRWINV